MKNVILGLSTLCMVAFTSCKDNAESKINSDNVADAAVRDASSGKLPVIQFNETEHDFGTIPNGIPVTTVFKYKNVGSSPLVVSDVKSTCGCTVPTDYTREVMPGETGQFTVEFNGKGNGNQVTKTITMTTNTEKGSETVSIKAFVAADPNAPKAEGGAVMQQQSSAMPTAMPAGAVPAGAVPAVKSSKQPGHEGHNHD